MFAKVSNWPFQTHLFSDHISFCTTLNEILNHLVWQPLPATHLDAILAVYAVGEKRRESVLIPCGVRLLGHPPPCSISRWKLPPLDNATVSSWPSHVSPVPHAHGRCGSVPRLKVWRWSAGAFGRGSRRQRRWRPSIAVPQDYIKPKLPTNNRTVSRQATLSIDQPFAPSAHPQPSAVLQV